MPERADCPLPQVDQIVYPAAQSPLSGWEPHRVLAVHAPDPPAPCWLWLLSTTKPETGPLTQPSWAWGTTPPTAAELAEQQRLHDEFVSRMQHVPSEPFRLECGAPAPPVDDAGPAPRRFDYPCG